MWRAMSDVHWIEAERRTGTLVGGVEGQGVLRHGPRLFDGVALVRSLTMQ